MTSHQVQVSHQKITFIKIRFYIMLFSLNKGKFFLSAVEIIHIVDNFEWHSDYGTQCYIPTWDISSSI